VVLAEYALADGEGALEEGAGGGVPRSTFLKWARARLAASRSSVTAHAMSWRLASGPTPTATMSALAAASALALDPPVATRTGVRCSPSSSRKQSDGLLDLSQALPGGCARLTKLLDRLLGHLGSSGPDAHVETSAGEHGQAVSVPGGQAGCRSGLAMTYEPTLILLVALAATARDGNDDSSCGPSGTRSVE
jgi:hypothetical protein